MFFLCSIDKLASLFIYVYIYIYAIIHGTNQSKSPCQSPCSLTNRYVVPRPAGHHGKPSCSHSSLPRWSLPSGAPPGMSLPSGAPPGMSLPSGAPPGMSLPSGAPPGMSLPSGAPPGMSLPSGAPPGMQTTYDNSYGVHRLFNFRNVLVYSIVRSTFHDFKPVKMSMPTLT